MWWGSQGVSALTHLVGGGLLSLGTARGEGHFPCGRLAAHVGQEGLPASWKFLSPDFKWPVPPGHHQACSVLCPVPFQGVGSCAAWQSWTAHGSGSRARRCRPAAPAPQAKWSGQTDSSCKEGAAGFAPVGRSGGGLQLPVARRSHLLVIPQLHAWMQMGLGLGRRQRHVLLSQKPFHILQAFFTRMILFLLGFPSCFMELCGGEACRDPSGARAQGKE